MPYKDPEKRRESVKKANLNYVSVYKIRIHKDDTVFKDAMEKASLELKTPISKLFRDALFNYLVELGYLEKDSERYEYHVPPT